MHYMFLRFPEGKPKAVTLSFDDGVKQDIKFSEIITKHGLKCTFNINSGMFDRQNKLSPEEIRKHILNKGHEIALHGEFHKANGFTTAIEGIKDVLNCRLALEKEFDTFITGMAYPDSGISSFHNGTSYETVKNYLTDLGVSYARTLNGDNNKFELPTDWHAWMPSTHWLHSVCDPYIEEFLNIDFGKISYASQKWPRLLYIWGHSYECDSKWERLEEMCQKLSGKDDIWYATNIEIYDYVMAYNSLKIDAAGEKVYNPTLKTVWFFTNEKEYVIGPGETLKLC